MYVPLQVGVFFPLLFFLKVAFACMDVSEFADSKMSLALFTICLISQMHGSEAVGGQCKTLERSVPGKALKGHTFKEFAVRAIVECQNTCENDPKCASYNFYIPDKVCELNSHTKETRPDDFVTDELRFYMRRDDDDECLKTPPVCDINANCKNTLGSYLCSCKEGFKGDGKTCQDEDECQISTHNCSDNANCINTEGSFNCSCKPGYMGDGHNCSDADECLNNSHNCSENATCTNTEGSFNCSCKPGYIGNGHNCSDADECLNNSHSCSENATCTNTEGSFNCSCKSGYIGNGHNCSDSDECLNNSHNCSENATCTNTEGSFNCSCKPGYIGNGHNCSLKEHQNDDDWSIPSIYQIPRDTKVLSVIGTNAPDGSPFGILGSTSNGLLTNETWKCSSDFYPGWTFSDFDDQDWPLAKVIANHGDKPWNKIDGIAETAKWIWANKYEHTVYCRLKLQ